MTNEDLVKEIKNLPDFIGLWSEVMESSYIDKAEKFNFHKYTFGFAIISDQGGVPNMDYLYVNPSERNKGYGADIVNDLIEQYCEKYMLNLRCDEDLIEFYENLSFKVVGEQPDGMIDMMGPHDDF